ncbi:collagen alpha-2(I) chain-like [Xenopus laevis]|uniref:Collagen alpha-2(I) chain-like n=1 Tax=Xenopus laevis TaxID=8355 RepID=A0A8J1LM71_XENLA|nr:collagen alpha-2(I) chain-like [Xenopus laevis]
MSSLDRVVSEFRDAAQQRGSEWLQEQLRDLLHGVAGQTERKRSLRRTRPPQRLSPGSPRRSSVGVGRHGELEGSGASGPGGRGRQQRSVQVAEVEGESDSDGQVSGDGLATPGGPGAVGGHAVSADRAGGGLVESAPPPGFPGAAGVVGGHVSPQVEALQRGHRSLRIRGVRGASSPSPPPPARDAAGGNGQAAPARHGSGPGVLVHGGFGAPEAPPPRVHIVAIAGPTRLGPAGLRGGLGAAVHGGMWTPPSPPWLHNGEVRAVAFGLGPAVRVGVSGGAAHQDVGGTQLLRLHRSRSPAGPGGGDGPAPGHGGVRRVRDPPLPPGTVVAGALGRGARGSSRRHGQPSGVPRVVLVGVVAAAYGPGLRCVAGDLT